MKKINLDEIFIETLKLRYPNKYVLTTIVSEMLKIERESASRRLNGKVLFTVKEIGILSQNLGISLDGLVNNCTDYVIIPVKMQKPMMYKTFEPLIKELEGHLKLHEELYEEPTEIGILFDSIPLEFAMPHPYLSKFIFFKWGHYYVGTSEFYNFSSWEYPARLKNFTDGILNINQQYESVFYIWDFSVISNLVKEIMQFRDMRILNDEDIVMLKTDLHNMFTDVENLTKEITLSERLKIYISHVNIGMYGYYHYSKNYSFCYLRNYFIESSVSQDPSICNQVRNWVNSMKKVSTLISGSGARDRKLFFEEQRKIVDML